MLQDPEGLKDSQLHTFYWLLSHLLGTFLIINDRIIADYCLHNPTKSNWLAYFYLGGDHPIRISIYGSPSSDRNSTRFTGQWHPTLKVIAHNINHYPMLNVGGHPTISTEGNPVLQPSGRIVQKIIQ